MSDGFTLALFDADVDSPTVGSYGGSLGYANRTGLTGLTGGVLGVGFDAHGNFSSTIDGKTGGTGTNSTPSSISLRGSVDATSNEGYPYIAGTDSQANFMNNSDAATEAAALTRNVRVTVSADEFITVEWKTDGTESWETLIDHVDASAQMDLPDEVKVGFTKSFNNAMNAQINNLTVIPEPAMISLCMVFGGALLATRRIFSN
jgi:MSHA biogenesis protein MshQ